MSFRMTRFASAAALVLAVAACGDSSTGPGGEQELISRVTLTLTPVGGGTPVTAYIDDPDGLGPLPPSAQVGTLQLFTGQSYTGSVLFENRLVTPAENITEEVAAEDDEHGVIYTIGGTAATVTVTDADGLGKFLGLAYTVNAGGTVGAGTLRVVLCHYDGVVKPNTATACSGDTDVDVSFNYSVAAATLRDNR